MKTANFQMRGGFVVEVLTSATIPTKAAQAGEQSVADAKTQKLSNDSQTDVECKEGTEKGRMKLCMAEELQGRLALIEGG